MRILVNGDLKNLTAIDHKGGEYTNDLLCMYDALKYSEEDEEVVMSEYDFYWWQDVIDMLNKISIIQELAYSNGNQEEFDSEVNTISDCDLDQQTAMQLEAAEKLAKELDLFC